MAFPTKRDTIVRDLAELLNALQVPVSMHLMSLQQVGPIFDRLHTALTGFGYTNADELERKLRAELFDG